MLMRGVGATIIACVLVGGVGAQSGPPGGQQAAPVAAPNGTGTEQSYTFPSGAGLLFFYVKPDKTADFEAVMTRLGTVLDASTDPVRKRQAANWRILKSVEATHDDVIYVMVFDPAVVGADYDPVKVLSEGAPADVQTLYTQLRDAVVRVERMGLDKIR
jgi:hypothetical protein